VTYLATRAVTSQLAFHLVRRNKACGIFSDCWRATSAHSKGVVAVMVIDLPGGTYKTCAISAKTF